MLLKVDELEFRAICCQGRKRKYNYRHQKRASSPVYVEKWGHRKKNGKNMQFIPRFRLFSLLLTDNRLVTLFVKKMWREAKEMKSGNPNTEMRKQSLSPPLFKKAIGKDIYSTGSGSFWDFLTSQENGRGLVFGSVRTPDEVTNDSSLPRIWKRKTFLFLLFWLFCIQNVQKFRSEKCATYILLTLKSSILWLVKGRQNLKNLEAN